ncbi:hypothetical protein BGZ68_006722, partial [Mortierella alpina]
MAISLPADGAAPTVTTAHLIQSWMAASFPSGPWKETAATTSGARMEMSVAASIQGASKASMI